VRRALDRDQRILPLKIASFAKQLRDNENHDGATHATSGK
jgi:hypothetical protein